ncbi:MAG: crossover junction endodeoxyribonuclease RuvC [Anaerolineae bacterium]|nr:crossover junction endodeoxyribonuclease RuvC [Anaerolineae bacterium]
MTRILGLDPSTVATGWALLDDGTVLASGVFRPEGDTLDEKLAAAHNWLWLQLLGLWPQAVAVETPFFKLNAKTLVTLAQLGAAYRLAATMFGLPVVEVTPAVRCTAVGLGGNAAKEQVLYTVNAVFSLDLTDHNESDAVAIAAAAEIKLREKELSE